MKMYTRVFNRIQEAEEFVNASNIQKKDVLSLSQTADGTYLLVYYGEQ